MAFVYFLFDLDSIITAAHSGHYDQNSNSLDVFDHPAIGHTSLLCIQQNKNSINKNWNYRHQRSEFLDQINPI
jgi:hypothetical protein